MVMGLVLLTCLVVGAEKTAKKAADNPPKIGKLKPVAQKTPNTIIEDVTGEQLTHLLDEHEHVAVVFYDTLDKKVRKILAGMEQMETEHLDIDIVR